MLNSTGITLALGGVVVAAVGMAPVTMMSMWGLAMSAVGAVIYVLTLHTSDAVPRDPELSCIDAAIVEARAKHRSVSHLLAARQAVIHARLAR